MRSKNTTHTHTHTHSTHSTAYCIIRSINVVVFVTSASFVMEKDTCTCCMQKMFRCCSRKFCMCLFTYL